jgi:hypothetical protein
MKTFDSQYKTEVINKLPLIFYFASAKSEVDKKNKTIITYKTQKNLPLKQLQTFPFYKPISKINY